jgi:predicted nucleotidyltransferase
MAALKCASLLRARGYLTVFSRVGKKRLYRLLSPEQALFAHAHMKNLDGLKQQRYLSLLIQASMQLHNAREIGLTGIWLFGSVARGEARSNSDVDLLVVAKNLSGTKAEMSDTIYSRVDLSAERLFLLENGFATDLSVIPMKEEELGMFYPIMLDVLDHGVVICERDTVLSQAGEVMKLEFPRLGIRRVPLRRGWMWILPPTIQVGAPIGVRETI